MIHGDVTLTLWALTMHWSIILHPWKQTNFPTTRMKMSTNLVHQYMEIFFNFSLTSNHLHPLQVQNCGSNSRLVVDEDDNGKLRIERVKSRRRSRKNHHFPLKQSKDVHIGRLKSTSNSYKLIAREFFQLTQSDLSYFYWYFICDFSL